MLWGRAGDGVENLSRPPHIAMGGPRGVNQGRAARLDIPPLLPISIIFWQPFQMNQLAVVAQPHLAPLNIVQRVDIGVVHLLVAINVALPLSSRSKWRWTSSWIRSSRLFAPPPCF